MKQSSNNDYKGKEFCDELDENTFQDHFFEFKVHLIYSYELRKTIFWFNFWIKISLSVEPIYFILWWEKEKNNMEKSLVEEKRWPEGFLLIGS